jgi:hypothetical protein
MNNIQKITIGNITINNPKQIALDGTVIWKTKTTLPKPVIQSGCSNTYTESQCPVTVYVTLQGYANMLYAEGNYTLSCDTGKFIESGISDSNTFYAELDGIGVYDIVFDCIDGYTWDDGTTEVISVTFEITSDPVDPDEPEEPEEGSDKCFDDCGVALSDGEGTQILVGYDKNWYCDSCASKYK